MLRFILGNNTCLEKGMVVTMWKVKQFHFGNFAGWWYAYKLVVANDLIEHVYFGDSQYESLSELTKLLKKKGEAYEMAD
jgi:IS1 family transposase